MTSQGIENDGKFTTLTTSQRLIIPNVDDVDTLAIQPRGKIIYDNSEDSVYVSDGIGWRLVGPPSGTVQISRIVSQGEKPTITNGGTVFDGSTDLAGTIEVDTGDTIVEFTAAYNSPVVMLTIVEFNSLDVFLLNTFAASFQVRNNSGGPATINYLVIDTTP